MESKKLLYVLLSIAVIAPIAILVATSIWGTILDLVNPCFTWGNVGGGRVVVSTGGTCTSAGGTSATVLQTISGLALIGGGSLMGAILGVLGIVRGRSILLLIGSVILFAESAPLIFGGEFVFTLALAGFFLWIERSKTLYRQKLGNTVQEISR